MKIYIRCALVSLVSILSQLQPILAQEKLDAYPGSIVYFGHGGGFTGLVTTYALLQNGDLYRKKSFGDQNMEYITKADSAETKSIFINYSFLGIDTMQLSEPGNTYYFISMKHKNTEVRKLVWSRSLSLPGNLKTFYDQLMKLVQSNQN
jgi:hypothetical protein